MTRTSPFVVLVGFICCGAGVLLAITRPAESDTPIHAGVFEGEINVQLDPVRLTPESEHVTHQFELINRTTRTVSIDAVQPSCGCLSASADRTQCAPGEVLTVTATMHLTKFGEKREFVQVVINDAIPLRLSMRVVAEVPGRLVLPERMISFDAEGSVTLWAFYLASDNAVDPGPITTSSEHVDVEAGVWEMVHPGDAIASIPARWRAQLTVRARSTPARVAIEVHCGDDTASLLLLPHNGGIAADARNDDANEAARGDG